MLDYYTAIGFDRNGKAFKYRNISRNNMAKFEEFLKRRSIVYVNYYNKKTREYSHRNYVLLK